MDQPTFNEPDGFLRYVVECEIDGERGALLRTAEHFGVERSTVTRAAKKANWRKRYRGDVKPLVQARECERAADAVIDWRKQQIQTGELLRQRGLDGLSVLQPNTVREAHDLIKLGSDLIAKGHDTGNKTLEVHHTLRQQLLPTQTPAPRLQVTVDVAEDLDDLLTDEEKQAVLNDLESN